MGGIKKYLTTKLQSKYKPTFFSRSPKTFLVFVTQKASTTSALITDSEVEVELKISDIQTILPQMILRIDNFLFEFSSNQPLITITASKFCIFMKGSLYAPGFLISLREDPEVASIWKKVSYGFSCRLCSKNRRLEMMNAAKKILNKEIGEEENYDSFWNLHNVFLKEKNKK